MSQLSDLARPFAPHLVSQKPGPFPADYVSHDAVTQKLLAVLGPFSFRISRVIEDEHMVTGVVGALTVTIDGREVTVEEAGDVENPTQKKTNGARMKDATSDSVKRCAMRLGCGLSLWADNYFLYDVLKDRAGENGSGQEPGISEEAGSVSAADPALSRTWAEIRAQELVHPFTPSASDPQVCECGMRNGGRTHMVPVILPADS